MCVLERASVPGHARAMLRGVTQARREWTRDDLAAAAYPLLNSLVVPRPIAWVSTVSAAGVVNLAPHSYFTVASVAPPVVQFTSIGRKDSLRNVEETGEFVVNLAAEALREQVNATGTNYPPDVDELAAVGLTAEPAAAVRPPRVAESPAALECRVVDTRAFARSTVVFGEVVHVAVQEAVLREGRPRVQLLRPVARLGGDEWSTVGEVFELLRAPYSPPS
jgi:flavin reductase (DIM6/NTAB) family NADH-FMN oxidoreductase RutF